MKHLVIGSIFIIIGLSLFSPLDEIIFLLPLIWIFGEWIVPLWTGIAILCLGIGVYLVGRSKWIPNPIAHHIWLFTAFGVAICAYFVWLMYPW